MKGDEMETKKIGGSVNLMVRRSAQHPLLYLSNGFMNISTREKDVNMIFFLFYLNPELLQIRGQQGGHVHPLHSQAV